MRILIANKFWYRRGGADVYAIELMKMLRAHGHETAVFSMQHPDNLTSEWEKYWPSRMNVFNSFNRPLGTYYVQNLFNQILDDFSPDIVHLNNIHSQLSPAIARIAHQRGIKVVWTIHDCKLLCPRYDCLQRGRICCEECFGNSKWPVLRHICFKNSLLPSIAAFFEAKKWSQGKLDSYTDTFICPSEFMRAKMLQGGFSQEKLKHLCNFIDTGKCVDGSYSERQDYICYIGRLSHEKGIGTLIKAVNGLPYKLIIVGDGPMRKSLEAISNSNVEFVGKKNWDEIKRISLHSRFMVIPSECYENNPLSVIEALCLGTPVLGARVGGIPELIDEQSGMTFESGNVEDLSSEMKTMFSKEFQYDRIASVSQKRFTPEKYYSDLMKVYSE